MQGPLQVHWEGLLFPSWIWALQLGTVLRWVCHQMSVADSCVVILPDPRTFQLGTLVFCINHMAVCIRTDRSGLQLFTWRRPCLCAPAVLRWLLASIPATYLNLPSCTESLSCCEASISRLAASNSTLPWYPCATKCQWYMRGTGEEGGEVWVKLLLSIYFS